MIGRHIRRFRWLLCLVAVAIACLPLSAARLSSGETALGSSKPAAFIGSLRVQQQALVRGNAPASGATRARVLRSYGALPLRFELNQGQASHTVTFLARGLGYGFYLTRTGALLTLPAPTAPLYQPHALLGRVDDGLDARMPLPPTRRHVLGLRFLGANPHASVQGLDRLSGVSNYFLGADPAQWRTNVPSYTRVVYRDIYPRVDLAYYGAHGQVENDYIAAPGAQVGLIRFAVDGASRVSLNAHGDLVLFGVGDDVRQLRPTIYQWAGNRRIAIRGSYKLLGARIVGFTVARYDHRRSLIIDPTLSYSTYLGGGADEAGWGIALDGSGNAYITGYTASNPFPVTSGAPQGSFGGGTYDAFVTKLNATGTGLYYSTYLGGSGDDYGRAIALDGSGNAYVTGYTSSTNFPVTGGAYQRTYGGGQYDAFVAKVNSTGSSLTYSTYLGGGGSGLSGLDEGNGIAVDSAGDAYISGYTASNSFPTTGGSMQPTFAGGSYDAFVTKLNAAGSGLAYSTYLGGNSLDIATGIALDASDNVYVTGYTSSTNLPVTSSAVQKTYGGGLYDAFVAKVNSGGSALVYCTYLGGQGYDVGWSIAVDSSGNAYIAGDSQGTDFPIANALQSAYGGGDYDGFVTKLNAGGSALVYSTHLGGSALDRAYAITVDSSGEAYVTGLTASTDFLTANALQSTYSGGPYDAFITKLSAAGTALVYSTYLGGSGPDQGDAIAVDSSGNAYVTGSAAATFPTTGGAYQSTYGGGPTDGYAIKVSP